MASPTIPREFEEAMAKLIARKPDTSLERRIKEIERQLDELKEQIRSIKD